MPYYQVWYPYYPGASRCQYEWPNGTATSSTGTSSYTSSRVTVPPPVEPVTLAEVKLDRRVDHDLDDALLESLIQAAREWCEGYTETSIVTQTRETVLASYTEGTTVLPFGPVQSVESVTGEGLYTVTYIVGYPATEEDPPDYVANVPASFKTAIKLLVGDWYENREHTIVGTSVGGTLQIGVQSLLGWYRVRRGFA